MSAPPLFPRPTSVFLVGPSRSFLNWVAYSLAVNSGPFFRWTDIRIRGELFEPTDILGRGVIPSDQLTFRYPDEMGPRNPPEAAPSAAAGPGMSPAQAAANMAALLRLPQSTREVVASLPAHGRPVPLVLSNAHRLVAFYPGPVIGQVIPAIVAAGAILIVTFADAPPDGRRSFDTVLHIQGADVANWTGTVLKVERTPRSGPFQTGDELRMPDVPAIADVLRPVFGPAA